MKRLSKRLGWMKIIRGGVPTIFYLFDEISKKNQKNYFLLGRKLYDEKSASKINSKQVSNQKLVFLLVYKLNYHNH
jgi:hypothetical protein